MVESLGAIGYGLALELLLASAFFWLMAVLVVRTLEIEDAAWRVRFFLLPFLVPIIIVPFVHLVVHPRLLLFPHPFVERLLLSSVRMSPILSIVCFSLAGAAAVTGIGYSLLPLVMVFICQRIFNRQRRNSIQWARCNRISTSVASKLHLPAPRIILTGRKTCGSLALGASRSYVIVAEGLASILDDEELECLLAHELGHVRRRDTMWGTAVGVCYRLLPFSPFCHVAYHSFIRWREEAADDVAVKVSGVPLALASCLIKAYRFSKGCSHFMPGSGALLSSAAVASRVSRLIKTETPANRTRSSRLISCAFSAVTILGIALLVVFV